MDFNKEFEKHLIEAIKDAITDAAPDLFNDMVQDNADWWADKLVSVFEDTVKKALKDDRLIKQILTEIIGEYMSDVDIYQLAEEIIEAKIKDTILDKITVEVKK